MEDAQESLTLCPNTYKIQELFWRLSSSGMWHCVMRWIITDVSKNRSSIIVEGQDAFPGIFNLQDKRNTFFWDVGNHSLNAERPITEDRNPSKISGSKDFKSRVILSEQRCDCFVTTLSILSSPCEGIRCCFTVCRVQHTRESWSRSKECRECGSCRFFRFFLRDLWRVFNKLRFPRFSQLHEKSLQC